MLVDVREVLSYVRGNPILIVFLAAVTTFAVAFLQEVGRRLAARLISDDEDDPLPRRRGRRTPPTTDVPEHP